MLKVGLGVTKLVLHLPSIVVIVLALVGLEATTVGLVATMEDLEAMAVGLVAPMLASEVKTVDLVEIVVALVVIMLA